jgi:hypothetical protein
LFAPRALTKPAASAGRDFHLKEKILCLWEMGNKSIIDAKVF